MLRGTRVPKHMSCERRQVWLASGVMLVARAEAYGVLAPVYGWLIEGFDLPDLKDSRTLIGEAEAPRYFLAQNYQVLAYGGNNRQR
jgi:hypothetical protein